MTDHQIQLLIACIAVLTTVYGIGRQLRRQSLQGSVSELHKRLDHWNATRADRQTFADMLLKSELYKAKPPSNVVIESNWPVLGFFEHLGLLTRRGSLDLEMVWCKFGAAVCSYYPACSSIIEGKRKAGGRTWYEEFEWLHHRIVISMTILTLIRVPFFMRGPVFFAARYISVPRFAFIKAETFCIKGQGRKDRSREEALQNFLGSESNVT